mmetsp:Transcript_17488/g.47890  ORF Transcript_17488/g.47890 Transcript_17488/m.47890 type:complete len:627 (+) Transcript_17488:97-1977(+)
MTPFPRAVITTALAMGSGYMGIAGLDTLVASSSSCHGRETEWRECPDQASCGSCVPVDCVFGDWNMWSGADCTGLCTRHRGVAVRNSECGAPCDGVLTETHACHPACAHPEVLPCVLSEWAEWSSCGTRDTQQTRERSIIQSAVNGGEVCQGDLQMTRPCHNHSYGNSYLSLWSEWGPCDAECGVGEQTRTRKVLKPAEAGGMAVEAPLKAARKCPGLTPCVEPHVDCKWSDWSSWDDCSRTCAGGSRTRTRHVATKPRGRGKLCEAVDKAQVEGCNTQSCHEKCVDGVWGQWSEWETCTATCSGGVTWRARAVKSAANDCGQPPVGFAHEDKPCNEGVSCAVDQVDCEFSGWTSWSPCSCTCDGWRERSRSLAKQGVGRGKFCNGPENEVESCNVNVTGCHVETSGVDCVLGDWSRWSDCSTTCGKGQQRRSRSIAVAAQGRGRRCSGPLQEIGTCSVKNDCGEPVAVDCKWADWNDWGVCTKCSGQRHRYRHIAHHAALGGTPCEFGAALETTGCLRDCDVPMRCVMADWQAWGACSTTCGMGVQERSRELSLRSHREAHEYISDEDLDGGFDERFALVGTPPRHEIALTYFAGVLSLAAVMVGVRCVCATRASGGSRRFHVQE